MFFKNARIFRFTRPVQMEAEQLESKLEADAFKPCGPQELSRQGWVAPLGKHGETLVHAAGGYMLICLQKQEKILPNPVVKEFVEERCEAVEAEQMRKVRRKEKDEIKEQVLLEMLPQAFPRNKRTYGYLSLHDGLLVVDAPTAKVAEEFASHLRKSLGSLPVRPPAVNQSPAFTFTGWLQETVDLPEQVVLGTDCWLEDLSQDGGKVTARGLDITSDEMRSHLDAGMQATRLTMTWDDNVSFSLDEDLGITRLRLGDALLEKLDDVDADDALARFDAAFSLMTLELSRMIPELLEALGGEDRTAIVEGEPVVIGVDHAQPFSERTVITRQPEGVHTEGRDPFYEEAVAIVAETRRASISSLQRALKLGYNRVANLIDVMETAGVVSAVGHSGAREVLIPKPAVATA
ncbi:recombination-associated protein RdgC [Marinobacter salarius]|uniref:recombination-associated protein RdgC n=1 Tax=Marinobacter salarius TaxID=1420917 RepID=UPI003D15356C